MDVLSLAKFVDGSSDRERGAKLGDPGSPISENMAARKHSVTSACQELPIENAQIHDSAAPLFQKAAFGSELVFPSGRNSAKHSLLKPAQQSMHRLFNRVSSPRYNAMGKRPASQLTIFYSGTVNVYDDMPAEMAQAIMTLVACGENCKPSTMSDEASVGSNSGDISSVPRPSTSAMMNAAAADIAMETREPHTWVADTSSRSQSISTPILTFKAPENLPSGVHPMSSVGIEMRQMPPGRLHTDVPLPRKASLVRFLEKRRNMLQVVQAMSTNQTKTSNTSIDEGNCPPSEMAAAPKRRRISTPSPTEQSEPNP